jgi:short-subunit dehydrogenase
MNAEFKPLHEQVIVITGASSGIGLATARAAVAQGARVVLASRNGDALRAIEKELNARAGAGTAVRVVADVGARQDVQRISDTAIDRFDGFDTWVNNAGVTIYGRLEQISDEDSERLFQTNFWGTVYGSLIAVKHLKRRGGVIINVGSVLSDAAIPLQGMYSASKHAVKGFTDALRMELEAEGAPVWCTLIKPAAIDTPYPQHARNYMRREPKHAPPVYPPQEVARAILYAATHQKREIYVGGGARVMSTMARVAPRTTERVMGPMMFNQQRRNEPPRDPAGALHEPGADGRVHGDHPGYVMHRSLYTRSTLNPTFTGVAVAAAGVAVAAMMQSRTRRQSWYSPERQEMRRPRSAPPVSSGEQSPGAAM